MQGFIGEARESPSGKGSRRRTPSTGGDGDDGVRHRRGRRASRASIAPDQIHAGGRVEEAGAGVEEWGGAVAGERRRGRDEADGAS